MSLCLGLSGPPAHSLTPEPVFQLSKLGNYLEFDTKLISDLPYVFSVKSEFSTKCVVIEMQNLDACFDVVLWVLLQSLLHE